VVLNESFLSMKEIAAVVGGKWLILPKNLDEVVKNYAVYTGELLQENQANLFFAMDGPTWLKGTGNGGVYAASTVDTHTKVKGIQELLKMVIVQHLIPDVQVPQLQVEDSYVAMNKLFAVVNANHIGKNIGVTGTVGKSTVKNLLADLLSQKVPTHKTPSNYNSRTCAKVTVLNNGKAQINVLEIAVSALWYGKNRVGIAADVPLDLAILTQVGVGQRGYDAHQMADFKSRIAYGLRPGKPFLVNGDIENINEVIELAHRYTQDIITYGFSESCDFKAVIQDDSDLVVYVEGKQLVKMSVQGFDKGLASNVVAVVSAYHLLMGQISESQVTYLENQCQKLTSRKTHEIVVNKQKLKIIDDTHNAELLSMKNFIDYAENLPVSSQTKKIFIVGRIVNLGKQAEAVYLELAKVFNRAHFQRIYTYGPDINVLDEHLSKDVFGGHFDKVGPLVQTVAQQITENELVFIKGSSRQSRIGLIGNRLARDSQYIAEGGNAFAMSDLQTSNCAYSRNGVGRLLVILECLERLSSGQLHLLDAVPIKRILANDSSVNKVGLQQGERLTIWSLLSVALVAPTPDILINLAEFMGGSLSGAQEMLSAKSQALNLSERAVVNLTGRPTRKPQRTYLRDLEKIGEAFAKVPNEFFSLLGLQRAQLRTDGKLYQKRSRLLENRLVIGSIFFGANEANGLLFLNSATGRQVLAFINSPEANAVSEAVKQHQTSFPLIES